MLYNSAVSTYVKPHHVLSAINLVCMPNFIVLLHNTVERITKISDSIISKDYRKYFPSNILGVCNIYFIVRNLIFPNCIILLYIDLLWKINSMIHLFLVISIIWKCITRKKIQLHFRYEYINDYLTSLSGMSTLAYTLHHAITKVHSCKMRLTRKLGSWCIVVLKPHSCHLTN